MLMWPSPLPTTEVFGQALSLLAWIVASGQTPRPGVSGKTPGGSATSQVFRFAGRDPSAFLIVPFQVRSICALGLTFDPFFFFGNFGLPGLKLTVDCVVSPAANAVVAPAPSAATVSSAM